MITAVTTCMGRREHLELTLPMMLAEFERVIVVDWSCPQASGDWAEKEGAYVVRCPGEKFFSICKARNLGAKFVDSQYVCFVDADVMVLPDARLEIERLVNLSTMVLASRNEDNTDVHCLGGFVALEMSQFLAVGGYDETLRGYALEDVHLRSRLLLERGVLPKRLSPGALAVLRHSNELRGRYFEEDIKKSATRNYESLMSYLAGHGVTDWLNDPRTRDIAYRV